MLRKVLADQIIDVASVSPRWDQAIHSDQLQGQCVTSVIAIGKWLRFELKNETNLVSHMGMTGSWHIYSHDQRWRKPENRSAIVLHTSHHCIVCFTPKSLQLLTARQIRQHPMLTQLGPDILADDFDADEATKRILSQGNRTLAETSLDQSQVTGIGNVYRSESLFVARLSPFSRSDGYDHETVRNWLVQTRSLMLKNLDGGRRKTRFRTSGPTKWVYRRNGQHCLICDNRIERRYVGERNRSIYWCPHCQAQ